LGGLAVAMSDRNRRHTILPSALSLSRAHLLRAVRGKVLAPDANVEVRCIHIPRGGETGVVGVRGFLCLRLRLCLRLCGNVVG
jgi:hypothetical protein